MELSQLWQDIYQEAVQLAASVERLPNACDCGDADAHLEERCHCCSRQPTEEQRKRENCNSLLPRLHSDLTMLNEALALGGPAMEALALERQRFELRRGVFLAANDLQRIVKSFKRVTELVAGFRRDCAISRMRALKRYWRIQALKRCCAELRDHCERVNAQMVGARPAGAT